MFSRALATSTELRRRRIVFDSFCRRCVTEKETTHNISSSIARMPYRFDMPQKFPSSAYLTPLRLWNQRLRQLLNAINKLGFILHNHNSHYRSYGESGKAATNWSSKGSIIVGGKTCLMQSKTLMWLTCGVQMCENRSPSHNPPTNRAGHSRWERPKQGRSECNYDGSFMNQNRRGTAVWLIRDEQGDF